VLGKTVNLKARRPQHIGGLCPSKRVELGERSFAIAFVEGGNSRRKTQHAKSFNHNQRQTLVRIAAEDREESSSGWFKSDVDKSSKNKL